MTREQKLELLGLAAEHLENITDPAHDQLTDFERRLFDAVRAIGAVVEELVKEQADAGTD